MQALAKLCLAVIIIVTLGANVSGATITNAAWRFPASTTPGPTQPIVADISTYTINDLLGWTAGGTHLNESYVLNSGKTTALEFSYTGNQSSSMNGTTLTLSSTVSGLTAGTFLTGIQLSYETKWSNTGAPMTETWACSLNGGAYVNFSTNNVTGGSWLPETFLINALQLHNGDTIVLRDTFSAASGNGQSLDFDNFQITSAGIIPEPSLFSLLALGAVLARMVLRGKSLDCGPR